MVIVSIDGVMQSLAVDYITRQDCIVFSQAPAAGSTITIMGPRGTLMNVMGDGATNTFMYMDIESDEISRMLEIAFHYRHHPTVADMLQRLKVVVELARQ